MVTPSTTRERARPNRGAAPVLLSANVSVTEHANGLPHVRSTVAKMAELSTVGSQTYEIRNLATRITAGVPSKQYGLEALALYQWVRDNIRYRKDPLGREWLQSPARTVLERSGDCDDIATLLAALLQSLGHETRFHTVGRTRATQQHVAVEAFINGNWLTLDPVLEPAASSTAPRTDLGKFGQSAPGERILWSSEGTMLSGHHTRRRRNGLGSPVGPRGRRLWDWNPYYPPVGTSLYSGSQPAQGGVPAMPSDAYRSSDAPAFWGNRNLRALALRQGQPGNVVNRPLAGLGADAPPYNAKLDPIAGRRWEVLEAMKPAIRKLLIDSGNTYFTRLGFSAKNPPPAYAVQEYMNAHHNVGKGAAALKTVQTIAKVALPVASVFVPALAPLAVAANLASKVQSALRPAISVAHSAQAALKALKPLAPAVQAVAKGATLTRLPTSAQAVQALARRAVQPLRLPASVRPTSVASQLPKAMTVASRNAPHPAVRKKYPNNAKQVFDRKHNIFRVYVPKAKAKALHGLGAFRPTISFALGAAASSPASMAQLAQNAVNAVRAHGSPPAVKIPAVLAFQQADSQLSKDGLWGPNAQTAAAYYLGVSTSTLPAFAAAYKKYPVTWRAPTMAPATVVQPSAPAAVSMAQLAQNAVNAVRAQKTPPTGSVPAVLAFQRSDAQLLDDGKWGPNSQVAAAYYLGVSTSTLPPFATAFAGTKVTWHAPGAAAPTPARPAPAAKKPVATKPAPKPAQRPVTAVKPKPAPAMVQHTVTKPDGSREVVITAPSGGPVVITPSAPLPGYVEVGHETQNPGLPPVPATPATTAAAAAAKKKPAVKVGKAKPVTAKPVKGKKVTAKPVSMPGAPFDAPIPSDSFVLDTVPGAGPIPIPPGTSAEAWSAAQQADGTEGDNSLLWLAVGYLWLKQRKRAA